MAVGEVGFKRENGSMIGRLHIQKNSGLLKVIESTKVEVSTEDFIAQTAKEQRGFARATKTQKNTVAEAVAVATPKPNADPYAALNNAKAMQSNRKSSFDEDDFFSI